MVQIVRFGGFEVDLAAGRLEKRGVRIRLRDQAFQVLALLLEHPGQVCTREDLRRRLWRDDVFVDFGNSLNIAVSQLRTALGDSAGHPRFIETLPKRGYRFIGRLAPLPAGTDPEPSPRPRLLVLPFVNSSGDAGQEYLTDAMTDEVITALANLAPEHLAVIARTTAMHYKGSHKDIARIGRELAVDYVVEGALRYTEDSVAANVQIIRASDQTHVFAGRFRAEAREIFHFHASIAHDLVAHIPSMADKVRKERIARAPTENLAAYHEYIKGRHEMWKWTPEAIASARQHYEAALALDPRFALACDGLANLHGYLGLWGYLPADETEPLRLSYGRRAAELDPELAEPRTHLAYHPVKSSDGDAYSINWVEAERLMSEAQELNPNSPLIRVRHAAVLGVLGRTEQAVAEVEGALESDPLSMEVRFWLIIELFYGRQHERALAHARQVVELEPGSHIAWMVLGLVHLGTQDFEESAAAFRRAAEISDGLPLMLGWLGLALGLGGHTGEARLVLERLRATAKERFVLPTSFAWVHLGLGEVDEAFAWMDRAIDRDDEWSHPLKTYPFLDPLRSDDRFRALLRKLNVEA